MLWTTNNGIQNVQKIKNKTNSKMQQEMWKNIRVTGEQKSKFIPFLK